MTSINTKNHCGAGPAMQQNRAATSGFVFNLPNLRLFETLDRQENTTVDTISCSGVLNFGGIMATHCLLKSTKKPSGRCTLVRSGDLCADLR